LRSARHDGKWLPFTVPTLFASTCCFLPNDTSLVDRLTLRSLHVMAFWPVRLRCVCVCVFTPHTRYDERDLVNCMTKIDTVDFHQTMDVGGIKFTPYHAGHVLGAAMFMIEIAGIKVRNTRILWWIATV
jgi:Cft2 family RNA processing exonuclease